MIAVDTNVLVYAHREQSPDHPKVKRALEALAARPEPWGLPVFCVAEFVRVVTHPRVFDSPTSLDRAFEFLATVIEGPAVRLLTPGPRFFEIFAACARHANARANLAFDAQIAAVCLEHGARDLWTLDRDFSRFPGLRPTSTLA